MGIIIEQRQRIDDNNEGNPRGLSFLLGGYDGRKKAFESNGVWNFKFHAWLIFDI